MKKLLLGLALIAGMNVAHAEGYWVLRCDVTTASKPDESASPAKGFKDIEIHTTYAVAEGKTYTYIASQNKGKVNAYYFVNGHESGYFSTNQTIYSDGTYGVHLVINTYSGKPIPYSIWALDTKDAFATITKSVDYGNCKKIN